MENAAYIDIHALQSVPYANLNRDDLGSPKTMVFGGAERTRVSSQSWKRVVRHDVEAQLDDPAYRTRRIIAAVADRLRESHDWSPEAALQGGMEIVRAAGKGIKLEKPKHKDAGAEDIGVTLPPDTSVLFYLPAAAIGQLAEVAAAHAEAVAARIGVKKGVDKPVLPTDEVAAILGERNASVRLFGRMMAELTSTEVDGAVQFAHAFTVHPTNVDVDFFTAVDDLLDNDDRGSGHMNEGMFSAGTFYRYASVNLAQLAENSGGDTEQVERLVRAFLRAFITTVPSGKQNATAATTPPDLVHIAVRSDRPVSFAGAFEEPITNSRGHFTAAVERIGGYAEDFVNTWWPETSLHRAYSGTRVKEADGLGERADSYPALIDSALQAVQASGVRGVEA